MIFIEVLKFFLLVEFWDVLSIVVIEYEEVRLNVNMIKDVKSGNRV